MILYRSNSSVGRFLGVLVGALALVAGPWLPSAWADVTVSYAAPASSFNPVPDGFQDTFSFNITLGPEATRADVSLVTGGIPVKTFPGVVPPAPGAVLPFTWDGRTVGGQLAAAGTYSVDVVVYDATSTPFPHPGVGSFNLVIDTLTASVSIRVPAKAFLVKNMSGRCGKLVKPSSHKWAGSVGYYSNAKCKGKNAKQSIADGLHGIILNKTINGHAVTAYPSIRISAYGGAAKGYPKSRARLAYGLNNGTWLSRGTVLTPRIAQHTTPAVAGGQLIWADDNSLYWSVYTLSGARYDVKTFTINVTYQYQR